MHSCKCSPSSYTAPEDYTEISGHTVTLGPSVSSVSVSVSIVNDSCVEGEEFFYGNLRNPVGPATLAPAKATIVIEDDDRKLLVLEACTASSFPFHIEAMLQL